MFCVVVLLSKQEGGTKKSAKKEGGKKRNNFPSKSKGAVMFPNVKIMVFLFLGFCCL